MPELLRRVASHLTALFPHQGTLPAPMPVREMVTGEGSTGVHGAGEEEGSNVLRCRCSHYPNSPYSPRPLQQ